MTPTHIHAQHLLRVAEVAGLHITRPQAANEGNLYLWITPTNRVFYIGKATDKGKRRILNEAGWYDRDDDSLWHNDMNHLPMEATVDRIGGRLMPLQYDPEQSSLEPLHEILREWPTVSSETQTLNARLSQGLLTVEEVERFLIYAAVNTGHILSNSQFAGQWEGQAWHPVRLLARVASSHLHDKHGYFQGASVPEMRIVAPDETLNIVD